MTRHDERCRFDTVLFDIDNVLVDTRASYLAAIQKTVERYFNSPGILSAKEVDQFKLLGGFNDDWDCTYGIVTFLETARQGRSIRWGDHRHQRLSIAKLGALFPERPLGVAGLLKRLRILYGRVETPSYNVIARMFQEIYLGKKGRKKGLIYKEALIFPKSLLQSIKKLGIRMGIVTGRNRREARFALQRFGVDRLFDCVVTIDDVRRAEKREGRLLRKPNPWPLLEAARRISPPLSSRFLYVGDLPDDILAARRAKRFIRMKSAAFPNLARDARAILRELRKIKPDFILQKPKDILRILFS